jgi:hypothetical protein
MWVWIVQSVWRHATGWTVRGSNTGGGEIFRVVRIGRGAHQACYSMGTGFHSRSKAARA